jgi:hypothetical protein
MIVDIGFAFSKRHVELLRRAHPEYFVRSGGDEIDAVINWAQDFLYEKLSQLESEHQEE